MTKTSFLIRSILYHWRTNVAVVLGVVAATAVIGGALVVGDSVRESLRRLTLERLGNVDFAMQSPRFVREDLATELNREQSSEFSSVAPALVMQGSVDYRPEGDSVTRRAGNVQIYAVDERLWNLLDHGDLNPPEEDEIVLSARTAAQLGVATGEQVTMFVELPSSIPRDSLLGARDNFSRDIPLSVKAVLNDDSKPGRFSLNPNQQLPLVAFVSLETLQDELDLNEVSASARHAEAPARVNALFAGTASTADDSIGTIAAQKLTQALSKHLTRRRSAAGEKSS